MAATPGHCEAFGKPDLSDIENFLHEIADNHLPGVASLEIILSRMSEGVLVADMDHPDQALCYVNPAFTEITGYSHAEAVGRNCRYLQGDEAGQSELQRVREALADHTEVRVRLRNFRKDGTMFSNDLRLIPVRKRGKTNFSVGIMKDVTSEVQANEAVEKAIYTDQATGLPNRYAFRDAVEALSERSTASMLLLKVDVMGFQDINSGLGYDVGNEVLRVLAKRVTGFHAVTCGKLGGNEFGLAFSSVKQNEARPLVDKVLSGLSRTVEISDLDVHPRFSAGYVICAPGSSATTMMRQLATAAAKAKRQSGSHVTEFSEEDESKARWRLRMTSELRHAIADEEFVFRYQPKVDLGSGRLVGAEALIRWQHPTGLRRPDQFVELAEETGLITRIGEWDLRAGAVFAAALPRRPGPLGIAINMSILQFTQTDLPAYLARVLADTKVAPSQITLELTESVMAENTSEIIKMFRKVRDLGVGLSIDDFGTGYSSLRYLDTFPITEIKIDRGFVSEIVHNNAKRVMVDSIIRIGRILDLCIVAEGIETEAERDLLKSMGCPVGQGYLFGKPMSEVDFVALALA